MFIHYSKIYARKDAYSSIIWKDGKNVNKSTVYGWLNMA